MPIHKRDRNFQQIVSKLDVKTIPGEYIQQLNLICENGERIAFIEEDIKSFEGGDLVAGLINYVEASDIKTRVVDVEIIVDYNRLEQDVKKRTDQLLKNDNS